MRAYLGTALWCCILFLLLSFRADAEAGDLDRQVLAETNVARQEPRRYAEYIREFKRSFIGKGYRVPGTMDMVMTSEGTAAVDEAVRFLSRQRPLPALTWSQGLAKAAADLVQQQSSSGATGHGDGGGHQEEDRQVRLVALDHRGEHKLRPGHGPAGGDGAHRRRRRPGPGAQKEHLQQLVHNGRKRLRPASGLSQGLRHGPGRRVQEPVENRYRSPRLIKSARLKRLPAGSFA